MSTSGIVNFGRRVEVSGKKSFMMDLREWHGVNIVQLADKSSVAPSVIYCMLLGRPVRFSEAVQVLAGLADLVGVDYAMEDVYVVFSDESEGFSY